MTTEPDPSLEDEGRASEVAERPIGLVRGTRDWLTADFARLAALERLLLDRFARDGFAPIRTPILEFTELHERKSGAGIVSKLYELADGRSPRVCLRPELTASIVRAFTAAEPAPPLPWRVSASGPVFRFETEPQPGRYREFTQVGVELLGAGGPEADAEVIGLADRALCELGVADATLRVGHVGLILELLDRSGLPRAATSALVDHLSEAAAEGRGIRALETALDQLSGWLQRPAEQEAEAVLPAVEQADDTGVDRLFRHLVPDVTGRREGHEIIARLRRKWDLGHSLQAVLQKVRAQVHTLADLRGPAVAVLDRLRRDFESLAPQSVEELQGLVQRLGDSGIAADRVELDLGFGHGIGFYSQMIFELAAPTPDGPVGVCHGGRYDGLARVLGSDRDDRGVGFAFGLERLVLVLEARSQGAPHSEPRGCLVASAPEARAKALRLFDTLRALQTGRWLDDGPLVLATDQPLDQAQARARALGLASLIFVKNERGAADSIAQYDWRDGTWAEVTPTAAIPSDPQPGRTLS